MKTAIRRTVVLLTGIIVLGLIAIVGVPMAQAGPVQPVCKSTVTSDVILTGDLDCSGNSGTDVALTVGADDITINLNGHSIIGPDSVSGKCPAFFADTTNRTIGILVDGFDNTIILNGVVRDFERGIRVKDATGVEIKGIEAYNNAFSAARFRENVDVTLNNVNFHDNLNDAMGVNPGSHVTMMNSSVVDNCASGIFVFLASFDVKNSSFVGNFRAAINLWGSSGAIENNLIEGNNSDTTNSGSTDFGQITLVDPGAGGDTLIRCNDIRDSIDANAGAIQRGIGARISTGAGTGDVLITKNIFTNNPQGGIFIDENGSGSSTIEVHKNSFDSANLAVAFDAGATNWTIDASKNFVGTGGYGAPPASNTLTTDPDLKKPQHCRGGS